MLSPRPLGVADEPALLLTGAEEEVEARSCQAQLMLRCPVSLMSPHHVERQRLTPMGLACIFSCLMLETLIGGVTGTLFANTSVRDIGEMPYAGPAMQRGHARALLDDASTCVWPRTRASIALSGFVLVDGVYEYMGYTTIGTTTGRYFYSSATGYYIHELYNGGGTHWFIQSEMQSPLGVTGLVYYWGGTTASTWPTEVTGNWNCYSACSSAGGSSLTSTSTGYDDLVTCATTTTVAATCADVETTECPWQYTDCKGLDLRVYTNDKFHWMGCCSNGCSASSWCGAGRVGRPSVVVVIRVASDWHCWGRVGRPSVAVVCRTPGTSRGRSAHVRQLVKLRVRMYAHALRVCRTRASWHRARRPSTRE